MTRINSRAKGRRYELHVGAKLREWWGGSPEDFRPAPLSGGWSKRDAPFDLIVPKGFPWGPECKHRDRDWTWGSFLAGSRQAGPAQWMEQARSACRDPVIPVVIFTRNREPDWLALPFLIGHRYQELYGLVPTIQRDGLAIYQLDDALRTLDSGAMGGGQ